MEGVRAGKNIRRRKCVSVIRERFLMDKLQRAELAAVAQYMDWTHRMDRGKLRSVGESVWAF